MGKVQERHILYYLNLAKANGAERWRATEQEYDQIVHSWNLLTEKQADFDANYVNVVLDFIWSVRT